MLAKTILRKTDSKVQPKAEYLKKPGRREALKIFAAAAVSALITSSCSNLLPIESPDNPSLQATCDLINQILGVGNGTGLYGVNPESDSPILMQQLLPEAPILVPQEEISLQLLALILATEDPLFFLHDGVNLDKLIKAGFGYLLRGYAQDSSTLTQQIARNIPGSSLNRLWKEEQQSTKPSEGRKRAEIALARALEERFSKLELALLYTNLPYLGQRPDTKTPIQLRGFLAASWAYFGQADLRLLTPAQMAHLAGMLHNPDREAPSITGEGGKARRIEVLKSLEKFGQLLSIQLGEGLILDRDRPFAENLLRSIDLTEVVKAQEDVLTPRLASESQITAPTAVQVIKYLQQRSDHPLKTSQELSIFTRIETTLTARAQRLLAEKLLVLSDRYQRAPVTGIIANKDGDVIALASVRGKEFHPFNLPVNCAGLISPLRSLVEISAGNAASKLAFHETPDIEIQYLAKNQAIWTLLTKFLHTVNTRDSSGQSINLQSPSDLKMLSLTPAELVRLYLPLIRTSADIPKHLNLVTAAQDVYSGKSFLPNGSGQSLIHTGIHAGGNIQFLELLREENAGDRKPNLSTNMTGATTGGSEVFTFGSTPSEGAVPSLVITPGHICLITVGLPRWNDSQMRGIHSKEINQACAELLRKLENG